MLEESTVETVILLSRRMRCCRGITGNFLEYGRGFQAVKIGMTRLMPCHPSTDCCIRSNQLIVLRFAPVVAEQAPVGPGNGEFTFVNSPRGASAYADASEVKIECCIYEHHPSPTSLLAQRVVDLSMKPPLSLHSIHFVQLCPSSDKAHKPASSITFWYGETMAMDICSFAFFCREGIRNRTPTSFIMRMVFFCRCGKS